jgi:hypothetical protein
VLIDHDPKAVERIYHYFSIIFCSLFSYFNFSPKVRCMTKPGFNHKRAKKFEPIIYSTQNILISPFNISLITGKYYWKCCCIVRENIIFAWGVIMDCVTIFLNTYFFHACGDTAYNIYINFDAELYIRIIL